MTFRSDQKFKFKELQPTIAQNSYLQIESFRLNVVWNFFVASFWVSLRCGNENRLLMWWLCLLSLLIAYNKSDGD